MDSEKVQVPAAPSLPGFDSAAQAKWRSEWLKAFKQAQVDHQGDEITQRAVATREANRVFRVEAPASYEEAAAIEDFKVLYRGMAPNGKFCVVTIDGKKHYFEAPAAPAAEAPKEKSVANEKEKGGAAK
jgi:hypothetical protein